MQSREGFCFVQKMLKCLSSFQKIVLLMASPLILYEWSVQNTCIGWIIIWIFLTAWYTKIDYITNKNLCPRNRNDIFWEILSIKNKSLSPCSPKIPLIKEQRQKTYRVLSSYFFSALNTLHGLYLVSSISQILSG